VNRVAIEYGRRWQLFYDSLDSKMVSPEQMEDFWGMVSRATRQFGLCDCTKESVEYFCNRLGLPQQLIDDVFDLFHKTFRCRRKPIVPCFVKPDRQFTRTT
jgi:hypothetical protein